MWVVFGALLGPEATGPFCSNAFGASSGVSFVPASGITGHCLAAPLLLWVCGLWCPGVWLMGLLFENYIVDASIWNTHVCVFLQQFLMNEPGPCGHGSLE